MGLWNWLAAKAPVEKPINEPIKPDSGLARELAALKNKVSVISNDYANTLNRLHSLDQKFQALVEMLGVDVVADYVHVPPRPVVISTRDNGLMSGNAAEYLNATLVAAKLVGVMYKAEEQKLELFRELKRNRRTHLHG